MKMKDITKIFRKAVPPRYCGAVIVAAGTASRMGGIDKVMAPLGGEPMILRTVRAFQNCASVQEIVIVTREDLLMQISDLCHGFDKVRAVVVGGSSRQESVHLGLNALSEDVELAAIQDGARPLITEEVIERVIRAADHFGAAIPAVPVKDTIKVAPAGLVQSMPDRKSLQAVQTPQVFEFDLLRAAMKHASETGAEVTDDSSAVELLGMTVKVVEGDERNIKVTTPLDLTIAEVLLEGMQ